MSLQLLSFAAAAYLLGSIPFGKLIASRVASVDITRKGSGNIGATNVAREIGLKWGVLTLALDLSKGLLPVLLFRILAPAGQTTFHLGLAVVALSGLLGHQFSLFEGFRGGKGVATALGVFLGIYPLACLLALVLFVLTVYKWNYVSLGSILAASSIPPFMALFGRPPEIIIGSLVAAVLICVKHRENIDRLLKGKEATWRGRRSNPIDPGACPAPPRNKNR